ncbi:hypothetical protein LTS08_003328 [Lithohypha guttulata]|nr:hypothetical protein LTS08_003328 [Lithohypha guttulata]
MAPIVSKAPLFCCLPGEAKIVDGIDEKLGDVDKAKRWYPSAKIRVKFIEPTIDEEVCEMVVNASKEWTKQLTDEKFPRFDWVSKESEADIRISFDPSIPSWSAIGTQAQKYDKSKATMNICLGGWGSKIVWTRQQVARVTAHMFGHALGLPHAKLPSAWSSQWDIAQVEKDCGKPLATIIGKAQGLPDLTNDKSIMLFDRPSAWSIAKRDELKGGSVIDDQSLLYLKDMHGHPPPDPYQLLLPVFTPKKVQPQDTWTTFTAQKRVQAPVTAQANITLALRSLSLESMRIKTPGQNDKHRLRARAVRSSHWAGTYDIDFEAWDNSVMKKDSTCDILSFDPADNRVQTGALSKDYQDTKTDIALERTVTENVVFKTPFRNTPKVVAFIHMFDVLNDDQTGTAICVQVDKASTEGFEITYGAVSFASHGGKVVALGVNWLAHEADDYSISSGTLGLEQASGSYSKSQAFAPQFDVKPRYLFGGFSAIYTCEREKMDISCDFANREAKQFQLVVDAGKTNPRSNDWEVSWVAIR